MIDVVVVGAGIVGLATAYQLLLINPHLKIVILEKECKAALHQTSRNSGVIHSGVYYKPTSLKKLNCIQGKKQLIDFTNQYGIKTKTLGKVIIATSKKQISYLEELYKRGCENKVGKVELIDSNQLKKIEPYISALKAIWLPEVKVIKFKEVAEKLADLISESQSEILYNEKVIQINSNQNEAVVKTLNHTFKARKVVNCSGLFSDRLSNSKKVRIIPFRGEYFEVTTDKKNLINGLVYPIKDPRLPFLGVHLSKTIDGKLEAGPNAVIALAREGYNKNDFSFTDVKSTLMFSGFWKMAAKYWRVGFYELYRSSFKRAFVRDLKKIMPCIEVSDLKESQSGVRAQVVLSNGTLPDDFIFESDGKVLHVLNAPSPAATAALSIGKSIAEKVLKT